MKDEKILKNEVLNDEELEQVSGGGTRQVCGDNDLMNLLGCNHYDGTIMWDGPSMQEAVDIVSKGWAQVGIEMKLEGLGGGFFNDNQYKLNGQPIARKEAFVHAMKQRGWSQTAIDSFDWDGVKGAW